MERSDFLRVGNEVTVSIFSPDNSCLYKSTNSNFHSIESAIRDAIENANLQINPEDCVFEVTNKDTGVSHKYRLNAHGNLKLIV